MGTARWGLGIRFRLRRPAAVVAGGRAMAAP